MSTTSGLYVGEVMHERFRPRRHRLRYRVFSLLIDLDELPRLDRRLRLFGHNRPALFSFQDGDHGYGEPGALRAWIDQRLWRAGIVPDGGQVLVLCYPRILGHVFNPLTVYYCHGGDGTLRAVLYEVHNTFGERHTYVIPIGPDGGERVRQHCDKAFFVSPFIAMDCRYHFRTAVPDQRAVISIVEDDAEGPLLAAVFSGRRRQLTDAALLRVFLTHPLMTLKVVAGIHWEALKLWWKGVPLVAHAKAAKPVGETIADPGGRSEA